MTNEPRKRPYIHPSPRSAYAEQTMLRRVSHLDRTQPTHERHYTLMGEPLIFQTNDPQLLTVADDAFGRFPFAKSAAEPLVVRLFVYHPGPEPLCQQTGTRPRPIHHTQGHLFSISVGAENLAVVDLAAGYAFGYITPAIAADRTYVRYMFIEAMGLSMLSLGRQYVPIHAACVVKDGISLMLQASAGTGKSTLAYACVRRGYQLLAEDVVHVRVHPQGLELWGMPWTFYLLPDAKRFFPELAGYQSLLQMSGEWKLEVELESLFPGSTLPRAAPGPLVLLSRGTPATPYLERLSPAQARAGFEVLWPWQAGWTEALDREIQHLFEHGVYHLHVNGSPDEAVDALDKLLCEAGQEQVIP